MTIKYLNGSDIRKAQEFYLPPTDNIRDEYVKWDRNNQAYRTSLIALGKKYKKGSLRYRLKKEAIQNQLIDNFINKIFIQSQIRTKLKNQMIIDYFKHKKPIPKSCKLDCRRKGFGFCFCSIYW